MFKKLKDKKGFTLVELIVVLVILVILAILAALHPTLPQFAGRGEASPRRNSPPKTKNRPATPGGSVSRPT